MKERLPSLVALFLLIALVAATYWAAEYTKYAVALHPPARLTHEKDAWLRDFVMLRTDAKGQAINRLEGVYAEHFPDNDSYHVTRPRVVGQKIESPVVVGVSKTATMEQGGKRITMNGDAYVHRKPDTRNEALDVRSQQLIILPDDNVVYTEMPAEVFKGRLHLLGKGMHYNNDTRQLQIHAASEVTIAGKKDQADQSTPPSSERSPQ
jgi:lipopolysaccharide export system protein LptC